MKIKRDINGNKCLLIEGSDIGCKVGLVIQTNGNLPKCHSMQLGKLDLVSADVAWGEALAWVRQHGTESQRAKMGV